MAEGSAAPTRRIEGQNTLLARTIHALAYDEIHDEIVAPQPFSQALLIFRGGANGNEAPIRVIQGPKTMLANYVDHVAIDPVHNEIFVEGGYPDADQVLVFRREANGNEAPIRVLQGPDAFRNLSYLAVDPVHNLLLVAGVSTAGTGAVMIFDRTAQGNTKPLRVITGPRTGLGKDGYGQIFAYPPQRTIFMVRGSTTNVSGTGIDMPGGEGGQSAIAERGLFVNVWSIEDQGDVAPRRWRLAAPAQTEYEDVYFENAMGAGIDVKNKTILIGNKPLNAVLTYALPEIF